MFLRSWREVGSPVSWGPLLLSVGSVVANSPLLVAQSLAWLVCLNIPETWLYVSSLSQFSAVFPQISLLLIRKLDLFQENLVVNKLLFFFFGRSVKGGNDLSFFLPLSWL